MKRNLCHERSGSCPNDPIAFLKGWSNGEYANPCIACPPGRILGAEMKVILSKAKELDQLGYASMHTQIPSTGL